MYNKLLVKSAIAMTMVAPMFASAESVLTTGAGTLTAAARLDFTVVIPKVLFLAVGTGAAALTANPTIDLVTFDYTTNPTAVGTGAAAGAITGAAVPVRVLGNNGAITVTAATTGALTNGAAGDTIPWSQISAVSSDAANFPSPAIPLTGTGAGSAIAVSSGKVTNRSATWTYSYANTAVVAAGTYGAVTGNNSRITYTATMP